MTNEEKWNQIKSGVEGLTPEQVDKAQLKVSLETLKSLIARTRTYAADTEMAIDADARIRFKWVSDAMNALRTNQFTKFNYVTDKQQ